MTISDYFSIGFAAVWFGIGVFAIGYGFNGLCAFLEHRALQRQSRERDAYRVREL